MVKSDLIYQIDQIQASLLDQYLYEESTSDIDTDRVFKSARLTHKHPPIFPGEVLQNVIHGKNVEKTEKNFFFYQKIPTSSFQILNFVGITLWIGVRYFARINRHAIWD